LFCIIIYILSFKRILDGSALLALLQTGDSSEAKSLRMGLYTDGAYVFGLRLQYLNTIFFIFEFIFLYLLVASFLFKDKFYKVFALLFFIGILLWHLSNTSKGYIMVIFFYIFLILSLKQSKTYLVSKAIKMGLPLLILASLLAYFFMGNSEIYFLYPIERFTVGNLLPHYIIFSYFDSSNSLLGTSVPKWYTLGNHEQFLLAEWNWRFMNDKMNSSVAYNNPSSVFAELYANFSYFSFFYVLMFFTYVLLLSKILVNMSFFPLRLISLIYLTFYFTKYSVREFLPNIFDYRLLITLLVSNLLLYFIVDKRKNNAKTKF
jgi:hypothetical protein